MRKILLAAIASSFLAFGTTSLAQTTEEQEVVEEQNPLEKILKIEPRAKDYIEPITKACETTYTLGSEEFSIDPLMVLSIAKHESSFRQFAVSPYGAAGAYQFMPHIAWDMGMNVYMPDSWVLAWIKEYGNQEKEIQKWLQENGKSQTEFMGSRDYFKKADKEFRKKNFDLAIEYLEKAEELQKESKEGMKQYKKDILKKVKSMTEEELNEFDQRFLLDVGTKYCVDYLIKSDQEFYQYNVDIYDVEIKHDDRVLIASYHAGLPNVLEGEGIPMIAGSIKYQNKIYKTFLKYKQFLNSVEDVQTD